MHDPFSLVSGTPADPVQHRAVEALERQAAALSQLRARVADAGDMVPPAADSGWRGLAAVAFDAALHGLRVDVAAAVLQLDAALSDTRRALATLRGRG